jgi:MraZ protein
MALTGTYSRTLDGKQRLAIPKRLREDFQEPDLTALYIAPGTDKSLALYAPAAFQALAQRLEGKSSNRADVRNYLRLFYSRAERVELDGQGRIRVPERLVSLAQLEHEVVLLGVHDHAELWSRPLWEEFLARTASDFDKMAEDAFRS